MANRAIRNSIDEEGFANRRRSRQGSTGVSFLPKLSVYSITGTENESDLHDSSLIEEEEDFDSTVKPKQWWIRMAESSCFRQFFRAISIFNLVILILSVPFTNLNGLDSDDASLVTYQFRVVLGIDFMLSCFYTFHFIIRISYYWRIMREKKSEVLSPELEEITSNEYAKASRTLNTFILTLCMWYSVGIGIYRSVDPMISHWYYIGFVPRAIFAVFPSINLLLKVESSAARKLYGLLKWKQLAMVTGFYFIFMFIFALMGVHVIGGLNHICMERTVDEYGNYSYMPAIPFTHCNPDDIDRSFFCESSSMAVNDSTELVCMMYPNVGEGLFFNYRSRVYYGQYRVILDSLFAVYEASTLELWSLMLYTAMEGRGYIIPFLFYFFLIAFVVIILQQSIFLVVIIESFADLRDDSFFFWGGKSSSQKASNKPSTVLVEDPATNKLELRSLVTDDSLVFVNKYSKFLVRFEKFFLVLVIVDAAFTATKHVNIPDGLKYALQIWQPFVSVLFVVEISFILFFHLYHGQWKLFFRRPYYICLIILAIGGLVASLPIEIKGTSIYDPSKPATALAIFQAFRFPRLLRLSKSLLDFLLKITGKSIPILSIIAVIIILWLTLLNALIFGFSTDFPEECKHIASDHFGTYLTALDSTFQLVMNEAWTDVTSEVMCHSSYWFVTNLYFIIIHLFSSLIFLNFFGAVILDNLEYDEEEKKAKLEELKKKEAEYGETVPYKLKIFKMLGNEPKKLKPPPGIVEDPKLDELEVRKFFDAATTNNLIEDPQDLLSLQNSVIPHSSSKPESSNGGTNSSKTLFKQGSQLRQLSLVSSASSELIPSETTPELHGIYNSITSLLNYISLWRKYNEQEQAKDPRSSNIHYLFGQSPYERKKANMNNRNVKSEYEIFREKHRFFDMALFCMTPEHKLRKFCTKLLTAQADPPRDILVQGNLKPLQMFKSRIAFLVRWIVSQMPYCTWVILLGLFACVVAQTVEFTYDHFHFSHTYTPFMEIFYILMMLSWLVLKVISHGLFLNPHAAINSVWDVVDWILVLNSLLLFCLIPYWLENDFNWYSVEKSLYKLKPFFKLLYAIRCMRTVHIISILDSLRAVVREIVEGWRNLLKAMIILVGFIFMFASLGVQMFAGSKESNPLAYCNDPSMTTASDCVGEFFITVDSSREFISTKSYVAFSDTKILVPRVWYLYARDYPFKDVFRAFVTLYELLTLEGWPDVRDMFNDRNVAVSYYMKGYILVFVFFAVNIGLQLFLGIVVNNFNEHKPGHTFLLTVEQNRWAELMQRVSLQRPDKLPQEPRNNVIRLKLFQLLTNHSFRYIPTIIIGLSALTLVVPWEANKVGEDTIIGLLTVSIILNMYACIETILKLLAFGPAYFHSWRNLFDLLLSVVSGVYVAFGIIVLAMPTGEYYNEMSYFALVLAIVKLITVMIKFSPMLNLLLTVVSTILRSLSLIVVIGVIGVCYTFWGVLFFSNIRTGEAIDEHLVNFKGTTYAICAVCRSITGEDWYQMMWDLAVSPPYCDSAVDCGNVAISLVYFGSLTFFVTFILLNVFIAVLLENFSIFYNDEETNLDLVAMKDFKRKWRMIDFNARGHIPIDRVKLLLRSLDLQTYYAFVPGEMRELISLTDDSLLLWEMEEELRQEILSAAAKAPSHGSHHGSGGGNTTASSFDPSDINVQFPNILRMLAYRCEDIFKRLEPHELFTRKELEKNIQLDVAENCILKWLKKRVKRRIERMKEFQIDQEQNPYQQVLPLSIKEKRQRLFAMQNAQSQFLDVHGWGKQRSLDTEDEDTDFRRLSLSHNLPLATSDEQINYVGLERTDESCAIRSFNKIKQSYVPNDNSSAKEWLQMQGEWMDKIGTDQNYFDDRL